MALPVENRNEDTIAAAATAMSEAGIGIIRVSGPEAISICGRLYRNAKGEPTLAEFKANTIRFGYIVDPADQTAVDEVMVSVMKSPHSYTTEDTVEINAHGGTFVMDRILRLVLRYGARLAEPGEFTKRAYLGGRIDLARAKLSWI
jgi:tRNA modification GTPase